jgi:hypothetical protein
VLAHGSALLAGVGGWQKLIGAYASQPAAIRSAGKSIKIVADAQGWQSHEEQIAARHCARG